MTKYIGQITSHLFKDHLQHGFVRPAINPTVSICKQS
jgi:hypothetical protein